MCCCEWNAHPQRMLGDCDHGGLPDCMSHAWHECMLLRLPRLSSSPGPPGMHVFVVLVLLLLPAPCDLQICHVRVELSV